MKNRKVGEIVIVVRYKQLKRKVDQEIESRRDLDTFYILLTFNRRYFNELAGRIKETNKQTNKYTTLITHFSLLNLLFIVVVQVQVQIQFWASNRAHDCYLL